MESVACSACALSGRLIGFRHNSMHEMMSPSRESSVPNKGDRKNETERREFDDVNAQRSLLPTIQYPMINDSSDQRSMLPMMDWSTGLISFLRGSSSRTGLFAFRAPLRRRLGGCRERLEGTWVPLEGPATALGRLPGGSWQALGGFQEVSWTKDRDS